MPATEPQTGMRFASSLSREQDAGAAGSVLAREVRSGLGGGAELAFLFFSAHYAGRAEELCQAVRNELAPRVLLGCTGAGILAGEEEVEEAPAATLWAARLPGVHATPLRFFVPEGEDEFSLDRWPDDLGK